MTRLAKAMSAFNFGRSGSADGRDARSFAGRGASLGADGSGAPGHRLRAAFLAGGTVALLALLAGAPSAQAAPVASTGSTTAGAAPHLRVLQGTVNPNGAAVTQCRFAYGLTTDYGASVPCAQTSGEIGTGTEDVAVSAQTGPLEPASLYHYRLITVGSGQTVSGKDRTFSTGSAPADSCPNAARRAEQGIEVLLLPGCMALEQVSPPIKNNQFARPRAVSAGGGRVFFESQASLGGDVPNIFGLGGDPFIATRGGVGWVTSPVNPPAPFFAYYGNTLSFTPNFARWFNVSARTEAQAPRGIRQSFRRGVDGLFVPTSPAMTARSGNVETRRFADIPLGASASHSHLLLGTPEFIGDRSVSYLPEDPQPSGANAEANTYVAKHGANEPSLELLARDREDQAWGGNCGARPGSMQGSAGRNQGGIAADGSRIYFTTRPAQPEAGDCLATNRKRIMERLETPAGPEISEMIPNECDREAPPCATHDGDDFYEGASVDQRLVYFTTNRQLVDTDIDGSASLCSQTANVVGCDLYLLDRSKPHGQQLIQVSAGDETAATHGSGASVRNSIAGISGDGSHVYFVAQSVLTTKPNPENAVAQPGQNNLYLYKYPQQEYEFVGALAAGNADGGTGQFSLFGGRANWQNAAYPVPIKGSDGDGGEIGGSGHILLFLSQAPLTADDTDGGFRDVFRYDAEEHTLERVSKAVPGGEDNGSFHILSLGNIGSFNGTDYAEIRRWVSEDGETVVFQTAEGLVPGDVNGSVDGYLWRGGELARLPGSDSQGTGTTPTLSHDGSTVAYASQAALLPSDGDTVRDVYVARVNGGFERPGADPVCDGESCLGARGDLPGAIGAGSAGLMGRGNVIERADCAAPARRARAMAERTRRLRNRAKRSRNSSAAKRLRHQATRGAKRAQALRAQAKRCRVNNDRRAVR